MLGGDSLIITAAVSLDRIRHILKVVMLVMCELGPINHGRIESSSRWHGKAG